LMLVGIREILLISNPQDIDTYKLLLEKGKKFGIRIEYKIQEKPRGLAEGLILAEEFVRNDNTCLILGDNIFFGHDLPKLMKEAKEDIEKNGGAYVFGYYVKDPERFGVVEFNDKGNVISLEEKPKRARSNYAVVGLYFYDNQAIEIAKDIKPSDRGELEITSVNEEYLRRGKLKVKLLGRGFAWFDAGTYDSFLEAGEFVATIEKKTGLMIGCIEEIAYRNGWITRDQLEELAKALKKTEYGKYLLNLVKSKEGEENAF
ncbi:MAG TPA: glucose-1-phosphate thymidylyltransferase, partial [candidate division WOR-3 bacterium]|nr:glucose-1-phosphate thymidylyltransferase [candidate division WOR-3 bacterium]